MGKDTRKSNEKANYKKPFWTTSRKDMLSGYLFIAPEFIGIALLGIFPLLFSLYLSFTEWNLVGGIDAINFIGLDNFKYLFEDGVFHKSLINNLIFSVVYVDRKSTRLNSSHVAISYAVFCF